MAEIPQPINHTATAMLDAFGRKRAEGRGDLTGLGISVSELGNECDRALWYGFRWASPAEIVDGKKHRIFERGEIEEERLLDMLELICSVERVDPETGKQRKTRLIDGHVRGKMDGQCVGLPEAPTKIHAVECKSAKNAAYGLIARKGVREGNFKHYVQATIYAYAEGLDRALYLVTNKDNEEIYAERIKVDVEEVLRWLAQAERVIYAAEPPPKLHEDPKKKAAWGCGICKHKAACHGGAFAQVNCRTCLHATPMPGGDAAWNCSRWNKPLSPQEQQAGCGAHLFIPALVHGETIEVDENAQTITYKLADGSTWTDGKGDQIWPVAVADSGDDSAS